MAGLRLEVVTPDRTVISTTAESVIVPTIDGQMGFMQHHAPIVAGLKIGMVEFGAAHGEKEKLAITGGMVELSDNTVTVLADTAELAVEIDVARARAAKERAEHRLRLQQADIDYQRAEIALERALNRLRTSGND